MAYSYIEYDSNSSANSGKDYTYSFSAVTHDTANIKITVGGTTLSTSLYSIVEGTVTLSAAPGSGSAPLDAALSATNVMRIFRQSNRTSAEVVFSSASVLQDSDLNTANDQGRFLALEAIDRANESITIDESDASRYSVQVDSADKRIYGIADPVDDKDAVNKGFLSGNLDAIAAVNSNLADVEDVAGVATEIDIIVNKTDGSTTSEAGTNKNIAQIDVVADAVGAVNTVAGSAYKALVEVVGESTYKGKVEIVADSTYKGEVETLADSTYKGQVETVAGSSYKTDVETVAESAYKGKVETVAGSTYKTKVEAVADNVTNVNNFANTYLGAVDGGTDHASAPTTNRTTGDLYYNTNSSLTGLFVYNGSAWVNLKAAVDGDTITSSDGNNLTLTTDNNGENVIINTGDNSIKLPSVRATLNNYVLSMSDITDGTTVWAQTELTQATTSISPTEVESADDQTTDGNQTFVLTGTDYATSGMSVHFIASDSPSNNITTGMTVTHTSTTSLSVTIARSAFDEDSEPYSIKTTKPSGLTHTLDDAIRVDNAPSFTASANTIVASIADNVSNDTHATIVATDAEDDAITFAEVGTTLYDKFTSATPRGVQSDGTIKGVPVGVDDDETTTFTVRASSTGDGGATEKQTDQNFRFTITNYVIPTLFSGLIYTGDGSDTSRTTVVSSGENSEPDLVWVKKRSLVTGTWVDENHTISDSVGTGTGKRLYPNTNASLVAVGGITSFNTTGFTTSDGFGGDAENNARYVAWAWKAGGAPTATNSGGQSPTSGSVMINGSASTANLESATLYPKKMSINTSTGFSIVEYEGVNANRTIPHGLSQRPDFIIIKKTEAAGDWIVWHKDLTNALTGDGSSGTDYRIYLNDDLDEESGSAAEATFNKTAPTSDVVYVGDNGSVNSSGDDFIMYCFHSVDDVSAFGTYTSGDSGNRTVTLGWEPRFVMVKKTNGAGSWHMFDTFRGVSARYLLANSNGAEVTTGTNRDITINSTGFVAGTDGNVGGTTTGDTFIYMAFA